MIIRHIFISNALIECSEKVTACGVFLPKMQNLNLNLRKHHINASEEYSTCQGQKKYKERLRNYFGWEETAQTSQLNAMQNLEFDLETGQWTLMEKLVNFK